MKSNHRFALVSVTAIAAALSVAPAAAQSTTVPPPPAQPADGSPAAGTPPTQPSGAPTATSAPQSEAAPLAADDGLLQEVVVTAQRREESLQDVPVAITAITADSLEANRVTSVQDLTGLAPNLTVRPSSGGIALPTFTLRGVSSYGVVPGSDRSISIYVDGVYVASPRGSAFELPDIERIEVLRGPQGTLFGRNATAGAISVSTRNPSGVFGVRQDFSVGNYEQLRSRTTVDLPAVGPFSAYVTYVHDEREGDIRNLGAGTRWDRTGPNTNTGVERSPDTLGGRNAEQVFVAVRYEPSSNFDLTYKFDYAQNIFSPPGQAFVAYQPNAPLVGPLLTALINSQPTPVVIAANAERPDAVNNSFAINSRQRNSGHVLTANLRLSDSLSIRNIAAYRTGFINSAANLDGLGGLIFTQQALVPYATFATFSRNPALATQPAAVQAAAIRAAAAQLAPLVGSRFCIVCNNSQADSKQYSNELQVTYDSDLLSLIVGGIYFHQKDVAGGPPGVANNFQFTPLAASGRLPLAGESTTYSKGESYAGFFQANVHVLSTLDLVAGGRLTRDRKTGDYVTGGVFVPGPNGFVDGTFTGLRVQSYDVADTRPTYLVGANYKPNNDLLFYAKYSTAYVTGGAVADVPYAAEKVKGLELGAKADLLGRRLRTNLALFDARYTNLQSAQSGTNTGRPDLSTVIVDYGNVHARGFEFEATLLPVKGLVLNGSVGYTDINISDINPVLLAGAGNATRYRSVFIPAWTGLLSAQYTTPLYDETNLTLRADTSYRSRRNNDPNPDRAVAIPAYLPLDSTPAYFIVNGRVSIQNIKMGGIRTEIAGWVKNLTQRRDASFALQLGSLEGSDFVPARTYGVDVFFRF